MPSPVTSQPPAPAALPPGIYLITPEDLQSIDSALWCELLEHCAAVQWRSRAAPVAAARQLRRLCESCHKPFIVNNDIELALRLGADGVHLGRQDPSLAKARAKLGDKALIGISCYQDRGRAQRLCRQGADYVSFGACFASATKPGAPVIEDLAMLSRAHRALACPTVAIGGIGADNCQIVLQTGIRRLAVSAGVFAQPSPAAALCAMAQHPQFHSPSA